MEAGEKILFFSLHIGKKVKCVLHDSVQRTQETRNINYTDFHLFRQGEGTHHKGKTSLIEDVTRLQQEVSSCCLQYTFLLLLFDVSLKTLKRREKESLSPPPPYFCVNFLHLFTMLFVVSSPDNQVSKHITKSFMSKHAAPTRYSQISKTHSRLITFVFTKVVTWHQSPCFKDISLM